MLVSSVQVELDTAGTVLVLATGAVVEVPLVTGTEVE